MKTTLFSRGVRVLAILSLFPVCAEAGHTKNILVLRGESPELPASRILIDAIHSSVTRSQTQPTEFYLEAIDRARSEDVEVYEQKLANLLQEKYRDIRLDLVVAFTEPAVRFVLRERDALFPRVPLLLGMIDHRLIDVSVLPANVSLVLVDLDTAGTLRLALKNHPAAHHVFVASGTSRFDRGWLAIVQNDLATFEKGLTISYDANSTREDLMKHVAALPSDTIVLYTSMTRDGDGDPERPVDVLDSLRTVSRAPIYGFSSTNIGHGVVGGSVLDLEHHGRDLGLQAARILAGERPAPMTTPSITAVDARELRRFGITPAALPAGTVVANGEVSLWERDRRAIIIGSLVVSVETALIVALVRVAGRRRDAQRQLHARVKFDSALLGLREALNAAPPDRMATAIERELGQRASALGLDRVRRWNFGDADWDSSALRASQTLFRALSELPGDIQRELGAAHWKSGWALGIPLGSASVVYGAVFCLCRGDTSAWRAGLAELHLVGTSIANVLERKRAVGLLEQSHRLRGEILESLPANVVVLDREGVIIAVNRSWEQYGRENGVTSPSAIGEGASYREICLEGVRDGAEGAAQALAMIDAACRGEANITTFEYRCDSGARKGWFQMTAVPLFRPEGGAIVKHLDISEMKMTEIALRESEDRFRRIADGLPIAIWMSETDARCSYLNQQWLRLTGRTFDQEAGIGWLEGVHPEDRRLCVDTYMRAFNAREPFSMEYRIRRYDGEYRWLLDSGTPRYGTDGVFHGYVGGCVDITERKNAEQTLRDVNRRLILAQEDERRRIARDLHDHLSQQLALLAIDLQQLSLSLPKPVDALRDHLQAAWGRTAEIASDVHAISHRLHPSKMEALGLVATIRAHCRDVSRQSLAVTFAEHNVPAGIPADVSLGLFRVLEEALSNVAQHSGAREAHVTLDFDRDVVLRVSDNGRGFPKARKEPSGLGLVSMRERVEAMGGRLSIASRPGRGTVLEARVPQPRRSAVHATLPNLHS